MAKLKDFFAKLKDFFAKLKDFFAKLKVSENPVTFVAAKWLKKKAGLMSADTLPHFLSGTSCL